MEEKMQLDKSTENAKFCKFCGSQIPIDAVMCTSCGRQVEILKQETSAQPQIVINNANHNTNNNTNNNNNGVYVVGRRRTKNKWVAFFLCLCLGFLGAHKFYEGKIGIGILYLLTGGLFVIGWIIDIIILLFKPNPYIV